MDNNPITLKDLNDTMKEVLKWVKFSGMKEVKNVLETNLFNDAKKLVYHYTDGNRSVRDFKELAGVSKDVVAKFWKEWSVLGIVETILVKGGGLRAKKIFELKDFGIDVQTLPKSLVSEQSQKEFDTGMEVIKKEHEQ